MNLRRGLFRLWVVGSSLFVLATVLFAWRAIETGRMSLDDISGLAAFAVGVPLFVLALGASVLWALSGFSRR